jgi:hypothetical protein
MIVIKNNRSHLQTMLVNGLTLEFLAQSKKSPLMSTAISKDGAQAKESAQPCSVWSWPDTLSPLPADERLDLSLLFLTARSLVATSLALPFEVVSLTFKLLLAIFGLFSLMAWPEEVTMLDTDKLSWSWNEEFLASEYF